MTTPDPVMLRATGLGRRFGDAVGDPRHGSRGPPRRGPRAARAERRRQDDDGPAADRAHRAERGHGDRSTASTSASDPEEVRARVGILTETPGLYDKLSATANLDFFGRLYGLDADTRAERIERYLRLFALWDRRDDVAGTFSKGMKQKLAIARALLHDPAVVFLDEPTAALDPEAAFVVREAIETLRRSGRTIVLATHNLDEADRLCDRIAFVRGGLLRIDSPAALRGSIGAHGRRRSGWPRAPSEASLAAARAGARCRPCDVVDGGSVVAADAPDVDRAGRRPRAGRRRRRRRRGPRASDDARAHLLRRHGRPARSRRTRRA